jgi:hypothetical protein
MLEGQSRRWTKRQRGALTLLCSKPDTPGVLTTGASAMYDGQPWIHWRTAYVLHDRGEVQITPYGEADAEIRLLRP